MQGPDDRSASVMSKTKSTIRTRTTTGSSPAADDEVQADLGITFKDIYRLKLAQQSCVVCLSIYAPENTCLFINACCDYRLNKKYAFEHFFSSITGRTIMFIICFNYVNPYQRTRGKLQLQQYADSTSNKFISLISLDTL